ncbi:MAG: NAD(P)/FAD-dependent oxidoreductase [Trueperaceae bacterium]
MVRQRFDLVVVGGGLAGATLARAMAKSGARVLVLERERAFRDRVRGDLLYPWGAAEARRLGIYDLLVDGAAREVRFWLSQLHGAPPAVPRDLPAAPPHHEHVLAFFHPDMQSMLLAAAEAAGAQVERGATVIGVERASEGHGATGAGAFPRVRYRTGAGEREIEARLVVGADGRSSMVRSWAGFRARRDTDRLVLAGALLHGVRMPGVERPGDVVRVFMHPAKGLLAMIADLGDGRFRVYAGHAQNGEERSVSGAAALPEFVRLAVEAGAPRAWFETAELIGPLAAYQGADTWVDVPHGGGVVLVGDAAAANDPSWGSGTALTLHDVRILVEALREGDDWQRGVAEYGRAHARSYDALHRITNWLTYLYRTPGVEADAVRARALPLLRDDPGRAPDLLGLGPEAPSDEAARRRFFGEDVAGG